ncbi:MAG TPA: hypothetical protein VGU72_25630 [Beijerinckiaceae bacterium]|jgi:hypothetical protein|nr:hypothetical protein [Beijerinckiaceae bacterium]
MLSKSHNRPSPAYRELEDRVADVYSSMALLKLAAEQTIWAPECSAAECLRVSGGLPADWKIVVMTEIERIGLDHAIEHLFETIKLLHKHYRAGEEA